MSEQIVLIIVLIISVIIHEVAHGYAAWSLGDPTAKLQGRLTMNPLVHIDPFMSVIVPAMLVLSGSHFFFGAAKPVPYNPYNLRDQRYGEAKVAAAGPAANLLIAAIFGVIVRLAGVLALPDTFIVLAYSIIVMNIFLALFNLLPFPPLDGSKVFPVLLPYELRMKYQTFRARLEQNVGLAFILIFGLVFLGLITPLYTATIWLANLLVGL